MKRLVLISAAALWLATPAFAQGSGASLKVTTVLRDDGSRTDTQTDMEAHTSEAKTYDAAKKLVQRAAYTVDDQGRPVDGAIYSAKDVLLARVSYKYDPFGHISEQTDKALNGTVLRRLVYRYDANGRVVGADIFDAQGNPVKSEGGSASSRKKSRSR